MSGLYLRCKPRWQSLLPGPASSTTREVPQSPTKSETRAEPNAGSTPKRRTLKVPIVCDSSLLRLVCRCHPLAPSMHLILVCHSLVFAYRDTALDISFNFNCRR
ncbi:uncharacterized protein K460DRAFT_9912 [Cucurbitaria berberidis CBS 394.84]|uniref:Uncharacterized protein n=1 Tax=Cucurbitaria berberidis CBS 394.84 TaxID=1168544 RepID=A0A9P4LCJ5_9PLEO|nr:uncharacterized protein K460DRAFT_9912 [Cucurbitaria berberidis CBS 394.84]KAF1850055.1 hypothetical protein K460DRAFT_9912 [Cucurbitaria berberidis CBS 394.84]